MRYCKNCGADISSNQNENFCEKCGSPIPDRIKLIQAQSLLDQISGLTRPNFMGSIHMKKETITNSNLVENLVESELKSKMTNSLKSTLFNPVTKILIMLAIIFNLIWLLFIYIL